jgi:CxxC motif-containing protein (DUF1111 family)
MMRITVLVAMLLTTGAAFADDSVTTEAEGRDAFSQPFFGLDAGERERFANGRSLFRQAWVIAPSRDERVDGLGPLYNRLTCISCHPKNGRGQAPEGPESRMQAMLVRLSVAGTDSHGGPRPHPQYGDQLNEDGIPGVSGEGWARVSWDEQEVSLGDGERIRLRKPRISFHNLAYGALEPVLVSPRVGPPVYGLGLLDAVSDETLLALSAEPKPDGVRGRVNRVWSVQHMNPEAGRFGHKANMPDLRQQIAGAMIGDLGITSSMFPRQNCSGAQATCQHAVDGGKPELTDTQLDDLSFYLAHLAAPAPRNVNHEDVRLGKALFAALGCAVCHRPQLVTGTSPHYPRVSERTIEPYTDLLIHDMGEGLADGRPDYLAGGREWRTPPLWGIGLTEVVGEHTFYLHDGRARNLTEAILWHGGEAEPARNRFAALGRQARELLLAFLNSL